MLHDGVHPHLWVLAHEEAHVLAVAGVRRGATPMQQKNTCSQWHSTCFAPDPAHPTVPGASDSSATGVSPMLSRVGSVCRATGAIPALAGLSNASASCSRLGSGAMFTLVGGLATSSESEGCS